MTRGSKAAGTTPYMASKEVFFCLPFNSPSTHLTSLPGSVDASFCPALSGCREVVKADGRPMTLEFDENSWQIPTISVTVPPGKTLILVRG